MVSSANVCSELSFKMLSCLSAKEIPCTVQWPVTFKHCLPDLLLFDWSWLLVRHDALLVTVTSAIEASPTQQHGQVYVLLPEI